MHEDTCPGAAGRLEPRAEYPRPRPSTPVLVRGVRAVPVPSCLRLLPQRLGAAGFAVCSPPPPPEGFQRLSKVQTRYALKIGSGASNNFRLSNSSLQQMKIKLEFQNEDYECGWKPKSKYILLYIRCTLLQGNKSK
ncbi:uncharacterized protein J5F26_007581 isoform 1-T3 [Ciconia maguari]